MADAALARNSDYAGTGTIATDFTGGSAQYELSVAVDPTDPTGFRRIITSTGFSPTKASAGSVHRTMRQVVELEPLGFQYAMFSATAIATGSSASTVGDMYAGGNITLGNSQDYRRAHLHAGERDHRLEPADHRRHPRRRRDLTDELFDDARRERLRRPEHRHRGDDPQQRPGRGNDRLHQGDGHVLARQSTGRAARSTPANVHLEPGELRIGDDVHDRQRRSFRLSRNTTRAGAFRITGNVSFANNDSLYLVGDMTIVATGNIALPRQVENRTPGGAPVQLTIVSSGGGTITPFNNFTIPSTVTTLMFTEGAFDARNSSTFTGAPVRGQPVERRPTDRHPRALDDTGLRLDGGEPPGFTVRNVSTREITLGT